MIRLQRWDKGCSPGTSWAIRRSTLPGGSEGGGLRSHEGLCSQAAGPAEWS